MKYPKVDPHTLRIGDVFTHGHGDADDETFQWRVTSLENEVTDNEGITVENVKSGQKAWSNLSDSNYYLVSRADDKPVDERLLLTPSEFQIGDLADNGAGEVWEMLELVNDRMTCKCISGGREGKTSHWSTTDRTNKFYVQRGDPDLDDPEAPREGETLAEFLARKAAS